MAGRIGGEDWRGGLAGRIGGEGEVRTRSEMAGRRGNGKGMQGKGCRERDAGEGMQGKDEISVIFYLWIFPLLVV